MNSLEQPQVAPQEISESDLESLFEVKSFDDTAKHLRKLGESGTDLLVLATSSFDIYIANPKVEHEAIVQKNHLQRNMLLGGVHKDNRGIRLFSPWWKIRE